MLQAYLPGPYPPADCRFPYPRQTMVTDKVRSHKLPAIHTASCCEASSMAIGTDNICFFIHIDSKRKRLFSTYFLRNVHIPCNKSVFMICHLFSIHIDCGKTINPWNFSTIRLFSLSLEAVSSSHICSAVIIPFVKNSHVKGHLNLLYCTIFFVCYFPASIQADY